MSSCARGLTSQVTCFALRMCIPPCRSGQGIPTAAAARWGEEIERDAAANTGRWCVSGRAPTPVKKGTARDELQFPKCIMTRKLL